MARDLVSQPLEKIESSIQQENEGIHTDTQDAEAKSLQPIQEVIRKLEDFKDLSSNISDLVARQSFNAEKKLFSHALEKLESIIQQESLLSHFNYEELDHLSARFATIYAAIDDANVKSLEWMKSGPDDGKAMQERFLKLKDLAGDIRNSLLEMQGNQVENLVSLALEKLRSIIQEEKLLTDAAEGSHQNLEKLWTSFPTIYAAIHDAEAKSLKLKDSDSDDWKATQEGFLKIKDLACDIDDLLDRQIVKALTSQNEHDSDSISGVDTRDLHRQSQLHEQGSGEWIARVRNKVRKFLPPCLRSFALKTFEIRPLRNRMDKIISSLKDHFSVNWTYIDIPQSSSQIHVDVPFVGRDAELQSIIELLMSEEEGSQLQQVALPVISIIGPGGIGKTTLAQHVYNHEKLRSHFDIRVWVSDHDVNFSEVETTVPLGLEEKLRGKKFLLVLDDVWTVDINKWSQLKDSVRTGSKGSRILVTTQSQKVAEALSTSHTSYLQPLDKDDSWSLFCRIAFWEKSKEPCSELVDIGRKIVKRSGGVPLFVKAWGGILLLEDKREGWESISECEVWDAAKFGVWQHNTELNVWKDVMRTFERSYAHLPSHLKRRFKYLSLFPKGCWMDKELLTQLWMAEGFIELDDGSEEKMEEIGSQYFDDLLSETCFFKDIEKDDDGKIVRCKMLEPLHDVVHYISNEFSLIKDGKMNKLLSISSTCHLSLHCIEKVISIPNSLSKASNMRTLLCFGNPGYLKVQRDFVSHCKFLRVLDLSLTNIEELSQSVGTLKHLRYLNLSYTRIKKLPAFICNLYFLQTLKLSHSLLQELPKETWKLRKLRHLEIDGTPLNYLPYGIERQSKLRKLSEFIVGDESGSSSIGELGNLNLLQGRLIISNLDCINDPDDAARANLCKKDCIDSLILDGKKHFSSQDLHRKRHISSVLLDHIYKGAIKSNEHNEGVMNKVERVFEVLTPHENLRRLEIWNYVGLRLPKWREDSSLKKLSFLKLVKCLKMKHFPHLGNLPSLKCLHIDEMLEVEYIGCNDIKGFPKLERFVLERMLALKVWESEVEEGDMPCFVELKLSTCPKLSKIPCLPVTLKKLEIYSCHAIHHIHPLPALEHLTLKGSDNMLHLLPNIPKLISLKITLSSELTSFPSRLNQLKALRVLTIHFCPKLGLLPQELQYLTTLEEIRIIGCPLLTRWYEKEKSEDWPAGKLYISIDNVDYMDSKVRNCHRYSRNAGFQLEKMVHSGNLQERYRHGGKRQRLELRQRRDFYSQDLIGDHDDNNDDDDDDEIFFRKRRF